MKLNEVMKELKSLGNAQTVKTYRNHGAEGPMFGVKVGDLKKVLSRIKKSDCDPQELALALWDTNNSDAMYLAALLADGSQMTKKDLDRWAKSAWWYMLSEYSVPFVAAEHPDGTGLAKKWLKSKTESIASSGWTTYGLILGVRPDDQLDKTEVKSLLDRVVNDIDASPNRVRYTMNHFVICVGTYFKPLLRSAKSAAKKIGKVQVDMGATSCKVPLATDAIAKVESMGRVGKKRSAAKC